MAAGFPGDLSPVRVGWGRRRAGGTRLLGRSLEGERAVPHGATEQASSLELRRLSDAARAVLRPGPSDLLAHGDLPERATIVEGVGRGEALAFTARDLYAGAALPRRLRRGG